MKITLVSEQPMFKESVSARARVKITPREKRRHAAGREKNEGLLGAPEDPEGEINSYSSKLIRSTQREYSSKPLKHSVRIS